MKEKGFTLIELLAVIVILAIIALIATPIVLDIIEDSKKSSFVQTGNGIIDAAKYYYLNKMSNGVKPTEDIIINFPDVGELEFDGEIPKSGSIIITKEGKVALGITNNKYCVTKDYNDTDVTVTEDVENCKFPILTLSQLATTGTFSKVDGTDVTEIKKVHDCATDKTEDACAPGTEFAIKVNNKDKYRFYVLEDYGNKVTLIMDRNLGDNVAWNEVGNAYDYGPITALTALQEGTSTWKNLPETIISTFDYSDDREPLTLGENKIFTMYARLPKYIEINTIKNDNAGTTPTWLYINLEHTGDNTTDGKGKNKHGYWTSTVVHWGPGNAWLVNLNADLYYGEHMKSDVYGVRPVIELYK